MECAVVMQCRGGDGMVRGPGAGIRRVVGVGLRCWGVGLVCRFGVRGRDAGFAYRVVGGWG